MELFKIFGSILIDDKQALKSLKDTDREAYNANKSMQKLSEVGATIGKAVAIGAVAIGGSMIAITKKTMDTMENIDKASQRAGMGAEEFQRWAHVAGLSGIEMTKLEQAAIKNQRALAQASQGAGKASDAYKKMGIDVKGLTSDQVFEQVILSLSDMEDETARNAIANDIFGKSFADLAPLLNTGSEELRNMKGELDELGGVMSQDAVSAGAQLNDNIDRVTKVFGALVLEIGNKLIPIFDKFLQWVLDNKDQIRETFENVFGKIQDAIGWVIDKGDILMPILAGILGGIIAFKVISFVAGLFTLLSTVMTAVSAAGGIMNIVMAANPIGLVAIAIAALIAIGVLLWKNWDTVTAKASELWQGMKDTFGKIGSFIGDTMRGAWETVKSAVDKIKGFFNFKWAFPKLKMPHFKVSGSANPLKWLSDGVPKLNIEWYKDGGIMTRPTAFGMNSNSIMAGGEAGNEAILPLNESNLGAIGRGIANTMTSNGLDYDKLGVIVGNSVKNALLGMGIYVDDRQLGKVTLSQLERMGVFR